MSGLLQFRPYTDPSKSGSSYYSIICLFDVVLLGLVTASLNNIQM